MTRTQKKTGRRWLLRKTTVGQLQSIKNEEKVNMSCRTTRVALFAAVALEGVHGHEQGSLGTESLGHPSSHTCRWDGGACSHRSLL